MKSELKVIEPANIAKRIITMIMDAAMFFFAFAMLAAWVFAPIADGAFHYSDKGAKGLEYQVYSKLFVYVEKIDNDTYRVIENKADLEVERQGETNLFSLHEYEFDDPQIYKNRLEYYYCHYLLNNDLVFDGGAPEVFDKITIGDFTGSPISYFNNKIKDLTEIDKIKDECYTAEKHFYFSDYMTQINNELKGIQLFIILPPFVLSFATFYILVPLLYKNGETLGKKVTRLCLVSKDGYTVKKRQVVFRQLILLFFVAFSLFVVGVGYTSLATLGLAVAIYVLIFAFSKSNRSFADMAAYTTVIDVQKSVWFDSPEIEEAKQKELDEKMANYKKNKVENKNLIQVGSKIIDEEFKK